jgi:hypothetical protein
MCSVRRTINGRRSSNDTALAMAVIREARRSEYMSGRIQGAAQRLREGAFKYRITVLTFNRSSLLEIFAAKALTSR